MIINFVLPRSENKPVGGYKVVFQYAKKMSNLGNEVHIYFLINFHKKNINYIKKYITGILKFKKHRVVSWYDLENVHLHFDVPIEKIIGIKKGKIIATHWSTAEAVNNSKCKNNDKFYFLQDYEIFDSTVTKERLNSTWKLPIKKIVISKWLMKKACELGVNNETILLPNFLDTKEFPITNCKKKRDTVSFLWHTNARKQSDIGIEIESRLKKKYPNLKYVMFGTGVPQDIDGIVSINDADIKQLNDIYRSSIVYFMPSSKEGWGLTGMEAMACGAAVVSIDNGGIWEYADNSSATIVNNNIDELENAICSIIDNKTVRENKIKKAILNIKNMTLDIAVENFLDVLK